MPEGHGGYLNLLSRLNKMGIEPVRIALTATASPRVRDDLCRELELDPAPLEAGGDVFIDSSNRPELNLIVRVAESTEAKAEGITGDLTNFLMENTHDRHPGSAIVFMPHTGAGWQQGKRVLPGRDGNSSSNNQWSSQVTRFASYLEQKLEKRVAIYHGGMKTGARVQNQDNSLSQYDLGDLRGRSRESEQDAFMGGNREIIPVQPSEFIGTVEMFSGMPSDDHMARLLNILEIADSEKLNAPRFWVVRANVLHRRSLFEDEEKAWRKAVEGSDIPNQIRHKAHAGLASLYRKDGPLPNADEFLRHGLTAARTSRKQAEALQLYRDMVAGWDSKRWIGEMKWHDEHAVSTDVSAAATEAWYEQNGRNENAEVLCDFLSASGYHESWPNEVIGRLLESIPFSVLGNYSELSRKRLATFFEEGAESDGNSREECLALAMKMILEDDLSSKSIIRSFSADFFDPDSDTLRERLIRRYLKNPQDIDMFYTAVSEHYVPQTPAVISRWLKVFPSELVMSDSGKALAILEKGAGAPIECSHGEHGNEENSKI